MPTDDTITVPPRPHTTRYPSLNRHGPLAELDGAAAEVCALYVNTKPGTFERVSGERTVAERLRQREKRAEQDE